LKRKTLLSAALLLIVLAGCSAAFVPYTSDPAKKLSYAYQLVRYQGRPLPAEGLIWDSIEIYTKDRNEKGLMEAYWMYGIFFQSKAVEDYQKIYEQHGFRDKTANYKNRYEKSIEYLNMSEVVATKRRDLNMIANIYYNKSFAYGLNGDMNQACKELASSLEINTKYHNENPSDTFKLSDDSKGSFEEYVKHVESYMKKLKCE
jgi:hypothetical protein